MLKKIKILLNIPSNDTSQDERISLILEQILGEFELLKNKTREEKFFIHSDTSQKIFKNSIIPISYPFVQKILKINDIVIPEKEYDILDNGTIFIKNVSYIPHDEKIIVVEFESGFEDIPQKFLGDIFTLVIAEYIEQLKKSEQIEQNGKNIVSEELGPRSVRYELGGNTNDKNSVNSAKKRLKNACIPPHLKFF